MEKIKEQIDQATQFIHAALGKEIPGTGIILGSGLGALAGRISNAVSIPTSEIPHWPQSTVEGHAGKLIIGQLDKTPVIALQGRVHYYEGYSIQQVVFPIRVMGCLGITKMIITNAAGGINPEYSPGDLMIIRDHINLLGTDPLIGPNINELGPRFPDMSHPYDLEFIKVAEEIGKEIHLKIQKGVLVSAHGPSYETASEIKMMQIMGGDAVCMSTVPEVIAGVHMGMRILGISLISNKATGLGTEKLSHKEVQEIAEKNANEFADWIQKIIYRIHS